MAELRASDAERERVVEVLRAHAAQGRLDHDELEERIDSALHARTRAALVPLTADLPRLERAPEARAARRRAAWEAELRVYLGVITMLAVIWLVTGAGHPWPVYPALGWGLGLYLQRSGCSSRAAQRRLTPTP